MGARVFDLVRPVKLSPPAKAVLLALASDADDSGRSAAPIRWICETTCLARRTVIAALLILERADQLLLNRQAGRQTRYVVLAATRSLGLTSALVAPVPVQQPHGWIAARQQNVFSDRETRKRAGRLTYAEMTEAERAEMAFADDGKQEFPEY